LTVILGIDPGSRITGFGVIQQTGDRIVCLGSGRIVLGASDMPARLQRIHDELAQIAERFRPAEAAIERVFMNRNADSALKLGQARGAAIVALGRTGIAIHEYSATQIKQAIVGRGHAQKPQVQHMIRVLLGLDHLPATDEADALAVAVCHGHTRQGLQRTGLYRTGRGRYR
jgi:crossover junction endodeoxyribonuclease RuvC